MSEKVEYFVVMTVQGVVGSNLRTRTVTATGIFDLETRAEIFSWMKEQFPPELADLPVVFFSAEPNRIGGAA